MFTHSHINTTTDLLLIRQHQDELRRDAQASRAARAARRNRSTRPRRRWHWSRRAEPFPAEPAVFRSATGPPTTLEA